MRNLILFATIFFASSFITACKSKKAATTTDTTIDPPGSWVLQYDRGPCFGKCPVYTFYLLKDHTGLMQVKQNLMQPGWYAAPLDQKEVDALLALLESDKYWHPDLSDQPSISDQPSHYLEYHHPSGVRTLTITDRFNTDLSNLFKELNHMATESKWETTSLRPVGVQASSTADLIVQLKPGVDANAWIKKYESIYGATIVKRISPSQDFYLITKDPAKGSIDAFYQALKMDRYALDVSFDNKPKYRQ